MLDCVIHNPKALPYLIMMIALYLHLGPFARHVIAEIDRQIEDVDLGRWHAPPALQADEKAGLRPVQKSVANVRNPPDSADPRSCRE
jgi:hypothetical protein